MRPVFVGTIHLPPLPGSARGGSAAEMGVILDRARRDALAYAEGGADAVIVENFGDTPFVKDRVAPHTIAAMALAIDAVRQTVDLPIGVNVLRNDVLSAVSIGAMAGGRFVRANVYTGAAVTDQGLIEGDAEAVQALIRRLDADVQVWADVDVKHAAQLAPRPLGELAMDAIERGLARAVIVSGKATGASASQEDLLAVRAAIGVQPLYAGSGVTVDTIASILDVADGVIVGTAAKIGGVVSNPVDVDCVRAMAQAAKHGRHAAHDGESRG